MIRPQLPLNALRAFEASARHLSFTRAAVELCVTQAAVSHQVKSLEAQLNVTLFKRLPRGLMLTSVLLMLVALLPLLGAGVALMLVFALGSGIAAWAPDLTWLALGRAVQGAGAISAAVTAFLADVTRDSVRTKSMAMVGGSIALMFALSLVFSPALAGWVGGGGGRLWGGGNPKSAARRPPLPNAGGDRQPCWQSQLSLLGIHVGLGVFGLEGG